MRTESRRVFITGGGGFIGSHICERLVESTRITVYDSRVRDGLRYTNLLDHPNLSFVEGDILDGPLLLRSAEGAQIIIHLAAIAGVSNYYSRPVETMLTNAVGTSRVLDVARQIGPDLFVNFSTSEVYGAMAPHVREEDDTSQGPVTVSRWTYSVSKLAAEHLCFAYHRQHGLPLVSIRPFNVYGPRQVGEGAVQVFAPQALRGDPITLHNGGGQVRAWCYIDDLIDGLVACLDRPTAIGEAFNIGNPSAAVTVRELAERIVRLTGSSSPIVEAPHQPAGDIRLRIPSVDKARAILGFQPRVSLDEGLRRTVDWYRDVYGRA